MGEILLGSDWACLELLNYAEMKHRYSCCNCDIEALGLALHGDMNAMIDTGDFRKASCLIAKEKKDFFLFGNIEK